MSYLVLARKYRPQRFEDLVGQEHVARTLTNAIALGRVHHAFLFTGARGVGKTSAARILAKALCCVQGPTATPCGVCDFCKEIVSGQSVDVVEIDGASNRGVEDARNLREAVRYAPSKGRKKVYIIDEVHMFTAEAFNALLKTLEEPPPHVVFILATTEVHKIPITILSRCQRYDFKLIPTARLAEHLTGILGQENIAFEPEALRLLARQAAGSVRDALSLLDQMIAYVGDSPITHEKVAEVLGVADRRLLSGPARGGAGARRRRRRCGCWPRPIDRGIDLVQLARSFLGYMHDVEVVEPGGPRPATWWTPPPRRSPSCGRWRRRRRAAWPPRCSTAGRGRWTRRASRRPRGCCWRWRWSTCASPSRWCRWATCWPRLEELEARLQGGGPPARPPAAGRRRSGPRPASARPSSSTPRPLSRDVRAGPRAARASPAARPRRVSCAARGRRCAHQAGAGARDPGSPEDAWSLLRLRLRGPAARLAAALDHAEVAELGRRAGRPDRARPSCRSTRLEKDRADDRGGAAGGDRGAHRPGAASWAAAPAARRAGAPPRWPARPTPLDDDRRAPRGRRRASTP